MSIYDNLLPLYFIRLEEAINTILEKLEVTEHHVEHQFAAVDDHIDNMLAKLAKREDASESRIENLESVSVVILYDIAVVKMLWLIFVYGEGEVKTCKQTTLSACILYTFAISC